MSSRLSHTRLRIRGLVIAAAGDRQNANRLMKDWIKTNLDAGGFEFAWTSYFDLLADLPVTAPLFDDELRKTTMAADGVVEQGAKNLRKKCEADPQFARAIYDSLRVPVTNAFVALLHEELSRYKRT